MKKSLLAMSMLFVAFPTAASECDVEELWRTLDVAEQAVKECNRRLRVFDVNNETAEACVNAKASWIRHAAVFEVCLQNAKNTSALLGDDLHAFAERGKQMNDMQRINNEIIKVRIVALENSEAPEAGTSRNGHHSSPGTANEDRSVSPCGPGLVEASRDVET